MKLPNMEWVPTVAVYLKNAVCVGAAGSSTSFLNSKAGCCS